MYWERWARNNHKGWCIQLPSIGPRKIFYAQTFSNFETPISVLISERRGKNWFGIEKAIETLNSFVNVGFQP